LEIDTSHPLAGYVLARLRLASGETASARELLQRYLDEASPHPRVLALAAELSFRLGDHDEAERLYRLGTDRFPYELDWTRGVARVLLAKRDEHQLAHVLTQVAAFEPDNPTVASKLVQLALKRQDWQATATWANRVLQIDVMNAPAHAQLAEALAGQGDAARAIEQYQTALRLRPEQTSWQVALSRLLGEAERRHEPTGQARHVSEGVLRRDADYAKGAH
jgi:Tfp pilus assembly protein PilF